MIVADSQSARYRGFHPGEQEARSELVVDADADKNAAASGDGVNRVNIRTICDVDRFGGCYSFD